MASMLIIRIIVAASATAVLIGATDWNKRQRPYAKSVSKITPLAINERTSKVISDIMIDRRPTNVANATINKKKGRRSKDKQTVGKPRASGMINPNGQSTPKKRRSAGGTFGYYIEQRTLKCRKFSGTVAPEKIYPNIDSCNDALNNAKYLSQTRNGNRETRNIRTSANANLDHFKPLNVQRRLRPFYGNENYASVSDRGNSYSQYTKQRNTKKSVKKRSGNNYKGCHPTEEFRCHSNGKCILNQKLCDYYEDCEDGSDEIAKVCGIEKCEEHEWRCNNDRQCINKNGLCDGTPDCEDGSDERGCWQLGDKQKKSMGTIKPQAPRGMKSVFASSKGSPTKQTTPATNTASDDCFSRFTDPINVPEECPLPQADRKLCLKANAFLNKLGKVSMYLVMEDVDKERFEADISHIIDDKKINNGYSKYSDVPFIASSFKHYTVRKMMTYFTSCLTDGNMCKFLTKYMPNVTKFHEPCK